jgi:hypothetical protein
MPSKAVPAPPLLLAADPRHRQQILRLQQQAEAEAKAQAATKAATVAAAAQMHRRGNRGRYADEEDDEDDEEEDDEYDEEDDEEEESDGERKRPMTGAELLALAFKQYDRAAPRGRQQRGLSTGGYTLDEDDDEEEEDDEAEEDDVEEYDDENEGEDYDAAADRELLRRMLLLTQPQPKPLGSLHSVNEDDEDDEEEEEEDADPISSGIEAAVRNARQAASRAQHTASKTAASAQEFLSSAEREAAGTYLYQKGKGFVKAGPAPESPSPVLTSPLRAVPQQQQQQQQQQRSDVQSKGARAQLLEAAAAPRPSGVTVSSAAAMLRTEPDADMVQPPPVAAPPQSPLRAYGDAKPRPKWEARSAAYPLDSAADKAGSGQGKTTSPAAKARSTATEGARLKGSAALRFDGSGFVRGTPEPLNCLPPSSALAARDETQTGSGARIDGFGDPSAQAEAARVRERLFQLEQDNSLLRGSARPAAVAGYVGDAFVDGVSQDSDCEGVIERQFNEAIQKHQAAVADAALTRLMRSTLTLAPEAPPSAAAAAAPPKAPPAAAAATSTSPNSGKRGRQAGLSAAAKDAARLYSIMVPVPVSDAPAKAKDGPPTPPHETLPRDLQSLAASATALSDPQSIINWLQQQQQGGDTAPQLAGEGGADAKTASTPATAEAAGDPTQLLLQQLLQSVAAGTGAPTVDDAVLASLVEDFHRTQAGKGGLGAALGATAGAEAQVLSSLRYLGANVRLGASSDGGRPTATASSMPQLGPSLMLERVSDALTGRPQAEAEAEGDPAPAHPFSLLVRPGSVQGTPSAARYALLDMAMTGVSAGSEESNPTLTSLVQTANALPTVPAVGASAAPRTRKLTPPRPKQTDSDAAPHPASKAYEELAEESDALLTDIQQELVELLAGQGDHEALLSDSSTAHLFAHLDAGPTRTLAGLPSQLTHQSQQQPSHGAAAVLGRSAVVASPRVPAAGEPFSVAAVLSRSRLEANRTLQYAASPAPAAFAGSAPQGLDYFAAPEALATWGREDEDQEHGAEAEYAYE